MPSVAITSAAKAKKPVMNEPTRSTVTDCSMISANVAVPWIGCDGSTRSIAARICGTSVAVDSAERTNICIGLTGVTVCSMYTSGNGGLFNPSVRMSPTMPTT